MTEPLTVERLAALLQSAEDDRDAFAARAQVLRAERDALVGEKVALLLRLAPRNEAALTHAIYTVREALKHVGDYAEVNDAFDMVVRAAYADTAGVRAALGPSQENPR